MSKEAITSYHFQTMGSDQNKQTNKMCVYVCSDKWYETSITYCPSIGMFSLHCSFDAKASLLFLDYGGRKLIQLYSFACVEPHRCFCFIMKHSTFSISPFVPSTLEILPIFTSANQLATYPNLILLWKLYIFMLLIFNLNKNWLFRWLSLTTQKL